MSTSALKSAVCLAAMLAATAAIAQQTPPAPGTPAGGAGGAANPTADQVEGVGLNEIIVTASPRPERKIDSSISVSSVNAATIQQIAPQSAADLIRFIPGIRSEASGGEGNANIAVRGLPVASGGAKFVQFQEDGLPVLDFGDIAFATADAFVKVDNNVARVDLVRGGSASTATSNAPGAIINFITKDGSVEGGSIGVTEGVDFYRTRVDADYGGQLAGGWRYHVGGFYHYGEGPKTVGYDAEDGGQIKANVTKEFDKGFIRLDFKYLNDRTPVFLPVPVAIGAGHSPDFTSLPGFDFRNGALQTKFLQNLPALDNNGNRVVDRMSDGYRTLSTAFGGEGSYEIADGLHIDDKFRQAFNSGNFVGPYPANVDTAQNIANSVGGTTTLGGVTQNSSLVIATGNNAGQPYTGYAVNTVIFDTQLKNFDIFTNVLSLSKDLDGGKYGKGSITIGYFHSNQNLNIDWRWQDYIQAAQGRNSVLLNVLNPAGVLQTQRGLVAYDARAFGDCCVRNYDVRYTIDAPTAEIQWKVGGLNVDGSIRYDIQSARGTYAQSTGSGVPIDVNQDGIIEVPEQRVLTVDNIGGVSPVSYVKRYISYSVGANYAFTPDIAVFGRASRGARFNADRVLPGDANGYVTTPDAVNFVNQQELGAKARIGPFSGAITGFHATTAEQTTDITPAGITTISRNYRAYGVEFEGNLRVGQHFNVYGGVTWTDAKITADQISPGDVNNTPQRQAAWVYQFRPTFSYGPVDLGATIVGTSDAPADNFNTIRQPGFTSTGVFGEYAVTERFRVNLHVDNLFNVVGITEVDQFPNAAGVGSARSILGRTIQAGARFTF